MSLSTYFNGPCKQNWGQGWRWIGQGTSEVVNHGTVDNREFGNTVLSVVFSIVDSFGCIF